ncbi:hypothetical protein RJ641_022472 [Dillenia turbinata]|uniref:Uncharacterized protein n=1 Tax=Dillenia turbinata TaxID=194707 RepID=A0AAN8YTX8_9MAGN
MMCIKSLVFVWLSRVSHSF